jgi:sugar phosphate permease
MNQPHINQPPTNQPPAGGPIGKARWTRIGLLVFISYLVAFADRSNIGVAAPQMAHDLQLGMTITGALLSAFFWGYLVTQVPGGWLATRFGPARVIACSLVITGIMACLTGMVKDLHTLLAVRVLMGLAEGVIWPSFAVLFLRWFPNSERARAISFAQYALPLSSVVMAPLAGWMIDAFHWKTMFIMQGVPAIVLGLIFPYFIADDPSTDRWLQPAEREFILAGRGAGVRQDGSFGSVLSRPTVWLLALASFCWIMVIFSFGLWMPSLIKQYFTTSFQAVGWLTAIPSLFGAVSMYLNAYWSDRTLSHSRGWFIALPLTVAGAALLAQHYGPAGLLWTMVMFSIAGAGLFSGSGTWWAWAMTKFPRNQAGPSVALMNVFASCGGVVGPLAVGYVARGGSLANSFYILGYSLFAATALIVVVIMMPERELANASLADAATR